MPYKDPSKQKECARKAQHKYYAKHKEEVCTKQREVRKLNPKPFREATKKYHKNNPHIRRGCTLARSGWTVAEYDIAFSEQKGCCAVCKSKGKLHADHDHITGKKRELLCINCNTGIGSLKEDISILKNAISYLERHTQNV